VPVKNLTKANPPVSGGLPMLIPMLWIALIVLVMTAVAATRGHYSVLGFGIGAALLALWYLIGREERLSPASGEELEKLSESLHESSTEFDLPDFPKFLRRIVPHLSRGFGEREISRLSSFAESLGHNRECQTEFQVVFQSNPMPLRIRLFKDDASSIGVYFFTAKPLADLLDHEISDFFAERGM
jgi:hypothetical protein